MGKKSKDKTGKKEDKPKKEVAVKASATLQAALLNEGTTTQPKVKMATAPARTTGSKKLDRGFDPTKMGCLEGWKWDVNEKFPELPPILETTFKAEKFISSMMRVPLLNPGQDRRENRTGSKIEGLHSCTKGWQTYFQWRCGAYTYGHKAEGLANAEELMRKKTLKDGLSGPVTVCGMYLLNLAKVVGSDAKTLHDWINNKAPLHLILVGASAENEERILKETAYWDEVGYLLAGRQMRLYLTGKEMSGNYVKTRENSEYGIDMRVECWKGETIDFFLEKGRLDVFKKEETMIFGLNCGFGLALENLILRASTNTGVTVPSNAVLWSWLPALYFLASLDLPLALSGSSDVDIRGVATMMKRIVGAFKVFREQVLSTPFESCFNGSLGDHPSVIRGNSYGMIVRGQQLGDFPRISSLALLDTAGTDLRIATLMEAVNLAPLGVGLDHPCIRKDRLWNAVAGQEGIAPLKRYGNYPPEPAPAPNQADSAAGGADASSLEPALGHEDGEVNYSEDGAVGKPGEGLPCRAKCPPGGTEAGGQGGEARGAGSLEGLRLPKMSCRVSKTSEGFTDLLATVEGVFMADTMTARVGVKRRGVSIYYFDCARCDDVEFEEEFPHEVDHTTAKVVFSRYKAELHLTVRLLV